MKILKVRFKNLNSLEGEWEIDLTHQAYTSNGIFAITGPTGAGKTTLLDAICVALYGRTPRLKILSKSVNEVMTRQTGECFAEVIFATLRGIFRCHWSQHRARKRPEGELQQPRHEIVDHEKNVVLENMIKNVAATVEDVTGMNFDQFTRSIMLAQGSFAAFLQASADDRAPLLEQITGTEIYSQISQKVHRHTANQLQRYTQMSEELNGLALLSESEEATLQRSVSEKQAESEKLQTTIDTLQKYISWREKIETLKTDIINLEKQYLNIEEQLQARASQRSVLQRAKIASLHTPKYLHLQSLKTLQNEETEEINQIKRNTSTLRQEITRLSEKQEEAIRRFQHAEKILQEERKTVIEVKTLDAQIKDRNERRKEDEIKIRKTQTQIAQIQANIDNLSSQHIGMKKEIDHLYGYLEEHQIDATLIEKIAVFKEKNEQLQLKISNQKQLHQQLEALQKRRINSSLDFEKIKQTHAQSEQAYTKAEEEYSAITEEISTIREKHPDLYPQHEQLTKQLSLLQKLQFLLAEQKKISSEVIVINKYIEVNLAERIESEKEVQNLLEKKVSQEQLIVKQEEIIALNRRIKSYEEERAELQYGVPCPLCGSTAHPYGENTPPATNENTKKLEREKKLLLSIQARITELQTQMIYNRKQHAEYQQKKDDAEQLITSYDKEVVEICQTQGLEKNELVFEKLHDEIKNVESIRAVLAQKQVQLDTLEKAAADVRRKVDVLKEEQTSRERQISADKLRLENICEKENELKKEIQGVDETLVKDLENFAVNITPFGFSTVEQGNLSEILRELDMRKEKWSEAKEKAHSLEEKLRLTENTQQKEHAVFESAKKEYKAIQHSIDILVNELTALTNRRKSLYGEKEPDHEEQKCRELFSTTMQLRDETSETLRTHENKAAFLADQLARLLTSTSKRTAQIEIEQQSLLEALNKDGFVEIEDFKAAGMSEEQILELELLLKDLDESSTRLHTLLTEKKNSLSYELARNMSNENVSSLQTQIGEHKSLLSQILQEIGKLQGKLEDNKKLLLEQKQKRKKLVEQEKELLRWQKLDDLIGSASGKKFRNFAQGITFEIMVDLANKNLQKMSDRYILIRDSIHPLNLQIIDNYRAGDIRTTQNLSGGESFLVSLALALGLSNMAGNNIRVDSFFLDEGFGTLDEETLDIALQTLAGLQQDGKMIGVISHISLLKERLETQIQLIPAPGGHSLIEGPGVRTL
jgi:exonuclease SbcC